MKLIAYELNEVPWIVIDRFVKKYPRSTLATILNHSAQFTTVTKDTGDLHPWSTWPTLHRGVYNDKHQIHFINQTIDNTYPPIWSILSKNQVSVGLFGALQSWPLPKDERYSFYIPDTFAQSDETYPATFQTFQKFNLRKTNLNGGTDYSAKKIDWIRDGKDAIKLFASGLRFKTVLHVLKHCLAEICNQEHKTLRPVLQAPVSFDFYLKLIQTQKPQYSSYFTNHVAGIMHRYWKYAFPDEFAYQLQSKRDKFLSKNIERAMLVSDVQLKQLKRFCDKHDYQLMIASSMGQESVQRAPYFGELRVTDPNQLINFLGFTGQVSNVPAMQPDFAFVADTEETIMQFQTAVRALKRSDGEPLFADTICKKTLSISLDNYPKSFFDRGVVDFKNQAITFEQLGISKIYRDPTTGYHQPYGVAIFYGSQIKINDSRQEIESIQILPTILDCFGLEKQDYMASSMYSKIFNRLN